MEKDYDDPCLDEMRKGFRNLSNYMPEYCKLEKKLPEDVADRIVKENKKHILDFYCRFVAALRLMIKSGANAGYKLISVCGP